MTLLDPPSRTAYAPLSHRSRADLQSLPVLASLARPATPADRRDPADAGGLPGAAAGHRASSMSILANVAPFVHVPVTAVGTGPECHLRPPTWPVRPGRPRRPRRRARSASRSPPRQAMTIQIDSIAVLAGPDLGRLDPARRSTDQVRPLDQSLGLLVSRPAPDSVRVVNSIPTNGLVLMLPAETLTDRSGSPPGPTGCRRTSASAPISGMWARRSTRAGGSLPGHQPLSRPTGRHHVGRVALPAGGTVRAVPVVGRTGRRRAASARPRRGRPTPGTTRWTIRRWAGRPPTGRPTYRTAPN